MKRIGLVLLVLSLILFVFVLAAIGSAENSAANIESEETLPDVVINAANFPDKNFREEISKYLDNDRDGILNDEELKAVTAITMNINAGGTPKVSNVKGIEFFPNLEYLDFYGQRISSIDVSHNPKLQYLDLFQSGISSLDVTNNPELRELIVPRSNLKFLDLSHNPKLEELVCYENGLTELDLSNNPLLTELYCYSNRIKKLDLSHNPLLKEISCYSNQIEELILGEKKMLAQFLADGNKYITLDISQCPILVKLVNEVEPIEASVIGDLSRTKNSFWWKDTEYEYGVFFDESVLNEYYPKKKLDDTFIVFLTLNKDAQLITGNQMNKNAELDDLYREAKVKDFIARCYQNALGREGSEDEIASWAAMVMEDERAVEDIVLGILGSAEFQSRGLSNEEIVKVLYRIHFNREADEGGLSYWTGLLDSGEPIETIEYGLAGSDEFKSIMTNPSGI